MINIQLTQGLAAQINDEFGYLDQYKWYARRDLRNSHARYYAARTIHSHEKTSVILMHRIIMEIKLGKPLLKTEELDHIDHNGLNNMISNLRITTRSQNAMNQRKRNMDTHSKYKGVTWHKNHSKWYAQIQINGKLKYLGLFIIEEDAARAFDDAAKLYFGEYANLNFPGAKQ